MAKGLLDVLACPADKADLKEADGKLVCTKCDRAYELKEGIPILIPAD